LGTMRDSRDPSRSPAQSCDQNTPFFSGITFPIPLPLSSGPEDHPRSGTFRERSPPAGSGCGDSEAKRFPHASPRLMASNRKIPPARLLPVLYRLQRTTFIIIPSQFSRMRIDRLADPGIRVAVLDFSWPIASPFPSRESAGPVKGGCK